jgi:ubiquitin carboxyl-terminal hydrolase 22/27/51
LTISDLHFASLYPDIASASEQEEAEGVTKKKDMSLDGGTDKKQKNEKAKSNDNGNVNANNLDKDNVPAHLRKHAFGEEEYKNNAIAIGALSEFYYPLYPGYHLERMDTQKQLESLSKAATATTQIEEVTAQTASFAKESHGPKSKKEEPFPKSELFSPVRTMSINSSTQSNETLSKVTSIPNEAEIAPFTIPSFPMEEGSKIAPPAETSIPDVTASLPTETEPKPSPSTFSSEYDRFHKIHTRIRKQRRNLLAKARDLGTNNSSSQKKKKASKKRTRTDSNTSNTIKDSSKLGSPYTSPLKVTRNGSSHDSGMFIHTEDQREKDTLIAASRVEEWLEVIRQNRLDYWSREKEIGPKRTEVSNVTSMWPGLCQDTESAAARLSCQSCDRKSLRQKRRSKPAPKDDEVMICLECSFRGCGPDLKGSSSSQHLMQHFLHSGHFLGMTCGSRGEIFCMKCGDFVYHDVLDREKERVDIQVNVGYLGWERRGKTKRSFGFGENLLDDFIVLPHGVMEDKDTEDNVSSAQPVEPSDLQNKKEEREEMGPIVRKQLPRNKGMVLWKGFRALYPNDVTNELVLAAQQSLHRWKIYQGRFNDGTSASWGPQTLKFALHQQSRRYSGLEINRPVGLYNLGNTCYMSCILQCLISLVPLQKYFLHEVRHDHNVCQLLKSAASKASNNGKHVESENNAVKCNGSDSVCLACEMDKLFLLYYGSTIGMDVISAMKEGPVTTSSSSTMELSSKNTNDVKGVPVAPSDFLQTAWQCKGMSHLAGHEQRDAHEFLQAFLDIMGKHCLKYDQTIREMKEAETDNKSRNGDEAKIDEGEVNLTLFLDDAPILICNLIPS